MSMKSSFAVSVLAFIVLIPCQLDAQHSEAFQWAANLHNAYRIQSDIVYSTANNYDAKLDLYLPRTQGPTPVVVYIHGGGWVAGSKEGAQLVFLPYLKLGWAVANVEYRLAKNSLAPAAVEDCRSALRWVYRHAAEYGFDTTQILITGNSAGGHLSLTTGMLRTSDGFDRPPEWLTVVPEPPVAAIVNWYGITDVVDLLDGENMQTYAVHWLGTQANREEVARSVSPVSYVRPGLPPIVTVHGDQDQLVPYAHAVRLHEALTKAGVPNKLITVPGGRHGGFNQAEMERIFEEIFAFLREQGMALSD
jgi:acetyl esterase/lipase